MSNSTIPDNSSKSLNSLPCIQANGRRLKEITRDSLVALLKANDPPEYFVRGGSLVRFRIDEHNLPFLESINEPMLIGRLARVADFYQLDGNGNRKICDPPPKVAKDILAKGLWNFPPIVGIVEAPVLRPDGSIMTEEGYDQQTGLYYYPAQGFEMEGVPENPSQDEVQSAKELLFEVLQDFPFEDDASRANMLALMITPILRPAFDGCTPLALISAPQAGTGKTMLCNLVSQISIGHEPNLMPYSLESEEMRKRITSALRASANVIVIDNVSAELNSEVLASALTTPIWGDRLLGRNEMLRLPQRAVWIANGNNLRPGGDMPRRCYPIRLDAKSSQPWKRSGFHQPDLIEWVKESRAKLMHAIFVLVRAWVSTGKPDFSGQKIGGFTQWTKVVGGILEAVGITGFLANIDNLYEAIDNEGSQWEAFLTVLHELFNDAWWTTAQFCEMLQDYPNLADTIPDEFESPYRFDGSIDHRFKQKLGIELRKRVGTRYGSQQLFIEYTKDEHLKIAKWRVVCGEAGACGDSDRTNRNDKAILESSLEAPANPAVPANPDKVDGINDNDYWK